MAGLRPGDGLAEAGAASLAARARCRSGDGRRRSAALGVSTLTIVRVRNRSFDGYKMFLSPRSCTVATQRRRYHVVPSGMFQPFIPSESPDLLQSQFSVFATAVREFVEELYGVEELETGDGRVDPKAIFRRREARLLSDMLDHGSAALLYTGVGVNLLALRHEVCTVLVIDDPGWYERECGELRICHEYLQQCQQTDLLPDQRWVQLISLHRHGLGSSRGEWCRRAGEPDVRSATAGLMIVGLFPQSDEGDTTMAESHRMTAAQLADKLISEEHGDVLLESVAWMAHQLMDAEVASKIGAELGERTPDRVTHRNGYRPRAWETRVGEIELAIPRLRQGSYFPSFLEPRRRAEQALVAVVQEAYVNGVSTRKVDRLVEQLGLHHMSKDQVSRLCGGLDEQVRVFRERPLEGAYPICGWTPRWSGCGSGWGAPQGPGDRLRRARVGPPRGDRPGRR